MHDFLKLITTATLASAMIACGQDDQNAQPEGDQVREAERLACDHILNGPDVGADASAEATDAPESSEQQARVDVTLPSSGEVGYLTFTLREAGEVEFFFDEDVTFAVFDGDVEVDASATAGEAASCPEEVLKSSTYRLEAKGYTLALGPSSSSVVSFFAHFTARGAGE